MFDRLPEGLADFGVYYPVCCPGEHPPAAPLALRLADFDTPVIGEILQVTMAERNALLECVEHLQNKARLRVETRENSAFVALLDASPKASLPFTLQSLRGGTMDRGPRSSDFVEYKGARGETGLARASRSLRPAERVFPRSGQDDVIWPDEPHRRQRRQRH